jgi:methanogenic corrinoid protein MtbC1
MPQMHATIEALVEAGVRDDTHVIIGGAPVNQKYADEIKADGYAEDAGAAVKLVKSLLGL